MNHSQYYKTPTTWSPGAIEALPVAETRRYLGYALEHDNLEFARDLFKFKPNLVDYLKSNHPITNSTPYDKPIFCYTQTANAIDLVLSHELDIYKNTSNNQLAFIHILKEENFKQAQLLCEKIPNIVLPGDTSFKEQKLSLFEATIIAYTKSEHPNEIEKDILDLLNILVQKGQDVNSHFVKGGTALSFASRFTERHAPLVDFLLENGANPHISSKYEGETHKSNNIYPITMAAHSFNTPFLKKVLEYYHTEEDFKKFEEQLDLRFSSLNLSDIDLIKEFLNEQKVVYEKKELEIAISKSLPQLNNLSIPIKEKFKI